MVDGLVLAFRSAQVILNSLCSGIATWSLLSHHIYLLCAPRVFLRRLVGSLCGGWGCALGVVWRCACD